MKICPGGGERLGPYQRTDRHDEVNFFFFLLTWTRLKREHGKIFSAEIRNEWSSTSTATYVLCTVMILPFYDSFSKRRFANYTVVIPVLDTNTLNGAKANVWADRSTFLLFLVLFPKGCFGVLLLLVPLFWILFFSLRYCDLVEKGSVKVDSTACRLKCKCDLSISKMNRSLEVEEP